MDRESRTRRPIDGPEQELLSAFLDFQRDTLLWKVSGLTDAQVRRVRTPSGLSLLGLVKHLAYVERWWFQIVFAGRDLPDPRRPDDSDFTFRIEPGESAAEIIAFYRAECAAAREIVAAATDLDARARHPDRPHTLRRILIHMIEETARHNGHADIFRELTDGATGE